MDLLLRNEIVDSFSFIMIYFNIISLVLNLMVIVVFILIQMLVL